MSRFVNRFVQPNPQRWLINTTSFLNRSLVLPYFCNIGEIDYSGVPLEDVEKLVKKHPVFFAPNHPEFFSDWMLDAEIMSQVAPDSAKWANHMLVNSFLQRFWLAHNLIARVPNDENAKNEAFKYAVRCAIDGKGVLLHPEGKVTWCRNDIAELHDGIVRMALASCDKSYGLGCTNVEGWHGFNQQQSACIVPIVWKHYFNDPEHAYRRTRKALMRVADLLDINLGNAYIEDTSQKSILNTIFRELLRRDSQDIYEKGMENKNEDGREYNHRRESLKVVNGLISKIFGEEVPPECKITHEKDYTFQMRRTLLMKCEGNSAKQKFVKQIERILRMNFAWYSITTINGVDEMHPEDIAECIKRLRADYLSSPIERFWPLYFGARTAHVHVCEPIMFKSTDNVQTKLSELDYRMRHCLTHI